LGKFGEIWKDKDKRRGLIGTIIVHLVLLLALFFLALRTPLPLPGEEGVEVNFGYDEQGYGDIQSESAPPESQPTPPPPQESEPEPVEPDPVVEEEEIITQDIEEAPVIEEETPEEKPEEIQEEPEEEIAEEKEPEQPEEQPEEEPEEQPVDTTFVSEVEEVVEEVVEEPKPVVNERALYPGTSQNKSGTNQGIKEGPGDQGKPQGYKDSDEDDGRGGEGDGPSYYLGGRGSKLLEIPDVEVNEWGDVVVEIWVDRMGNVVKAQVKTKGTVVVDANQRKMAVEAALNSKFEEDPTAEVQQRGTITYTFILLK
jgi:outer membrane biosynthesis protein TonB